MEQAEGPSTINPGEEPPEEYFLFLKMGGEVAQLEQRFTAEDLKTAAEQLANLSFADLVQQIDETHQASKQVRDDLDDMPTGPEQMQAAYDLLAECRRVANDNFITLSSSKPSELRAKAFKLNIPASRIYDAASFPDKVHRLAKLIYGSENFDKYKYHKRKSPEGDVEQPASKLQCADDINDIDRRLEELRAASSKDGNPESSMGLKNLAEMQDLNDKAAQLAGLSSAEMGQLREALQQGANGAKIGKILENHIVHTSRGNSATLNELANAAKRPGPAGTFTNAPLLSMPPVTFPNPKVYSGLQPSISQVSMPAGQKNLLLTSMFNPDPLESETDRLHKHCLSFSTDSATSADALIRSLVEHSKSERTKKLRPISSRKEWLQAAMELGHFASQTTPPIIPAVCMAKYNLYVLEMDKDMLRNGADSDQEVLKLFVKLDDLLRMNWAISLAPEDHVWDYLSHPLTEKYLRQPLQHLYVKTLNKLKANPRPKPVDDDRTASTARSKSKTKKVWSDKVKKFTGGFKLAASLINMGGKEEHLYAPDGTTTVCGNFNRRKGCKYNDCKFSHHCLWCGDDHSLHECPSK